MSQYLFGETVVEAPELTLSVPANYNPSRTPIAMFGLGAMGVVVALGLLRGWNMKMKAPHWALAAAAGFLSMKLWANKE